jgi:hypothetical protein
MLSGAKHLVFLIETKQKQIPLPRLRDRDDMAGGFFNRLLALLFINQITHVAWPSWP